MFLHFEECLLSLSDCLLGSVDTVLLLGYGSSIPDYTMATTLELGPAELLRGCPTCSDSTRQPTDAVPTSLTFLTTLLDVKPFSNFKE